MMRATKYAQQVPVTV